MRRFTGNNSLKTQSIFSTNFLNYGNSGVSSNQLGTSMHDKEMQSMHKNQVSSNLNSFSNQTSNLLFVMQGLQLVTSQSNIILFAVGGVVWRGLGWKILAITGSLYGLCYLYERLMWTRKTQEKLFKKQYADYASSKLKLIVDLTSQNAACQVQQWVFFFVYFLMTCYELFFLQ